MFCSISQVIWLNSTDWFDVFQPDNWSESAQIEKKNKKKTPRIFAVTNNTNEFIDNNNRIVVFHNSFDNENTD